MLLCISSQGLITVHAPSPPVTLKSPSVLTIILHVLFFFPRILYHAIKAPWNSFAHPSRTPPSNVAETSEDDTQDSETEFTLIQQASTTPNDKTVEQSNTTSTSPVSCATTSPNVPKEFDINKETWKEAWCFANQITYPLRSQIARGYLEEKIYRQQVYNDIIALRELESRAWERGGNDSERGDYWSGEVNDDDDGWVEDMGGNE